MVEFYSNRTNEKIDIFKYVEQRMKEDETLKLYIAVDSKRRRRKTCYVVACVLYSPTLKKGAEIWFKKYWEKTPPDLFTRLWKEVELTVEWAPQFYKALQHVIGEPKNLNVHIDLNPDPKWRSYKVYKAGYSWVKSLGFSVESKPASWACRAADHLA
jgi:predicted RNase H-related nuclease YkuK (DUF458 family)